VIGRAIIAALLVACVSPARASNEAARAEAKRLKELADDALARNDAEEALRYFHAAYLIFPSPNLRYNLGISLASAGRNVEALEHFEGFLAEAAQPPEEAVQYARAEIARLSPLLGLLRVDSDRAATQVLIDGAAVGAPPLERRVAPGPHEVLVRAGARSYAVDVSLSGGEHKVVRATFSRGARDLKAVLALGGAALGVGVLGAGLLGSAGSDYRSLTNVCAQRTCTPVDWEGAKARADAGIGLLAIAGALAVTDAALWLIEWRAARKGERRAAHFEEPRADGPPAGRWLAGARAAGGFPW
jgi:hypothetical protein